MHAHFFMITNVSVYGADEDIADALHETVLTQLNGNYFWLIPHANSLVYPKQRIVSDITETFPRIGDVVIDRDGLTGLRVTVSDKVPRAVVCTMLPDFDSSTLVFKNIDPCYYADDDGYLFEQDERVASDHQLYPVYFIPTISSQGTSTNIVGTYATSTITFVELQSFVDGVEKVGMPVNGLLFKTGGEYELYSSSTIVYFNESQSLTDERDNLVAFWKHMITSTDDLGHIPVFDYIDLRFGSNVFYKTVK